MKFIKNNKTVTGNTEGVIIDICIQYDLIQTMDEWENIIHTTLNESFPKTCYENGLLNVDKLEEDLEILFEASQGVYL